MLEQFASGTSVTRICADRGIGRRALYAWMSLYPDFAAAWAEAKKYRAEAHAEDAREASEAPGGRDKDGTPLRADADDVNAANLRVKVKQWLALVTDPKTFGKAPDVQLTINNLHLTAVQEVNKIDTARRMQILSTPAAVEGEDYTIETPPAEEPEPRIEDLL